MSLIAGRTPIFRAFVVPFQAQWAATRCIATSSVRKKTPPPDFMLDQEPARHAREAAEQASRRKNVGPFPMGQPSQDYAPRRPWQDLGGGEKLGRTVVNSSNA
jgi:hypothetical protein